MTKPEASEQEPLRELVEKWRNERAIDYCEPGQPVSPQGIGFEAGLRTCAIELEALLPVMARKIAEARLDEANLWKDRWHMSDADVDWRKQRISDLEAS